jgi:hypothetical protein
MEKESLTKTMEENKSLQIQSNTMDTNDEKKKKIVQREMWRPLDRNAHVGPFML